MGGVYLASQLSTWDRWNREKKLLGSSSFTLSPDLIIMLQTISGMPSASGYTAAMFCFVMSFSSANKPRQKSSPWSYYLAFHGRLVNSKVEVAKEQECSVELLSTKLFWNLKVRDRQEDDLNNYMNRNLSRSPLLRICYLSWRSFSTHPLKNCLKTNFCKIAVTKYI